MDASSLASPVFFVEQYFRFGAKELAAFYKERQLFTKKHFFCYFDYQEEDGLVWNKIVFIVNNPDIWTQEEANGLVPKWLYIEGVDTVGSDGKTYQKWWGIVKKLLYSI
ncbi:hypothetical protein [Bacillus cihuensis]|uniref:hypothetical protein n=1 Tax=Bacillus cihuensis TaxID=1208599 RepID=UPI00040ECAB4|nr:hypothetical protein [Bacillus cihuensis]